MIIVEVGKSIEQALKKYKEKYIKLKISKQLNILNTYIKVMQLKGLNFCSIEAEKLN